MRFTDKYGHLPFVFSGNVSDLTLTGIDKSDIAGYPTVSFSLTVFHIVPGKPATKYFQTSFDMPIGSRSDIRLNLKEILTSFDSYFVPGLRGKLMEIQIQAFYREEEEIWSQSVIGGKCDGIDEEMLMNGKAWWTRSSQTRHTFKHGTEKLALYVKAGEIFSIYLTVYGRVSSPQKFVKSEIVNTSSQVKAFDKIVEIDCSYPGVLELAREKGFSDEIIAYDVFIDGLEEYTQRFIVKEDSTVKEFRFRNHLGVYDYLYASGEFTLKHDTETRTFVNSGVETELLNDGNHSFESNTGYIDSAEKAEMWFDFFASAERSVLEKDGSWRSIVVESTDNEIKQMELGSMSFKWHYSEKIPDRLPARRKLKPYIQKEYGISEL